MECWKCLLSKNHNLRFSFILLLPYSIQLEYFEDWHFLSACWVIFGVSIIHWTLKWTTRSFLCLSDLFNVYTTRGTSVYSLIQGTWHNHTQDCLTVNVKQSAIRKTTWWQLVVELSYTVGLCYAFKKTGFISLRIEVPSSTGPQGLWRWTD